MWYKWTYLQSQLTDIWKSSYYSAVYVRHHAAATDRWSNCGVLLKKLTYFMFVQLPSTLAVQNAAESWGQKDGRPQNVNCVLMVSFRLPPCLLSFPSEVTCAQIITSYNDLFYISTELILNKNSNDILNICSLFFSQTSSFSPDI